MHHKYTLQVHSTSLYGYIQLLLILSHALQLTQRAKEALAQVGETLRVLWENQRREKQIADVERTLHAHPKLRKPKQVLKHLTLLHPAGTATTAKLSTKLNSKVPADVDTARRLIALAVMEAGWEVGAKHPSPMLLAHTRALVQSASENGSARPPGTGTRYRY